MAVAIARDERKAFGRNAAAADRLRRLLAAIWTHGAVEQVFARDDIAGIFRVDGESGHGAKNARTESRTAAILASRTQYRYQRR